MALFFESQVPLHNKGYNSLGALQANPLISREVAPPATRKAARRTLTSEAPKQNPLASPLRGNLPSFARLDLRWPHSRVGRPPPNEPNGQTDGSELFKSDLRSKGSSIIVKLAPWISRWSTDSQTLSPSSTIPRPWHSSTCRGIQASQPNSISQFLFLELSVRPSCPTTIFGTVIGPCCVNSVFGRLSPSHCHQEAGARMSFAFILSLPRCSMCRQRSFCI